MNKKTGILFVGACGHLATTAMIGAMSLARGICPPTGMVSELKLFQKLPFPLVSDFVFGGWDIRPCMDSSRALDDTGLGSSMDVKEIKKELEIIQAEIFPGIIINAGDAISEISQDAHVFKTDTLENAITKIKSDIQSFKSQHHLDTIVVINLASTEPVISDPAMLSTSDSINKIIKENLIDHIRPSFVYAFAAITSGCAYINFTPSEGGLSQGLVEIAEACSVPVMGSDGKTGETLVKSALAPLFVMRNLEVLSWEGYNILGNMDGKILQHSENGATKIRSKDKLLSHILGYRPHSRVSIDYVPSLGDRKTAWDFIHFQGFLNTKMSLQFTWQGNDSALAAPLVLDLARFGVLALKNNEAGVMNHLSSFFKSPWGNDEHSLERQFRLLENYAAAYDS